MTTQTPDLAALILELRALEPQCIHDHMGHAIYQLGLTLISRTNLKLANDLYRRRHAKPFTVSGLMRDNAPILGNIAVGETAWIRLTALDAATVACLIAYQVKVQSEESTVEEIDHKRWQVIATRWDDDRLPGLFSYQALIDRHTRGQLDNHIDLRFLTATTFHSLGLYAPLPQADLIFGSLRNRWRAFTGLILHDLPDDRFDAFLNYHVELTHCAIRTDSYKVGDQDPITGFSGSVGFKLLSNSPEGYLMKKNVRLEKALSGGAEWYIRTLQLLGEFAHFSGVGYKTTMGFGVVR